MNILRKYLKDHNLTMETMGYMLGVTKNCVSQWSTRRATPRPRMAKKIEKVTRGEIPYSFWGYEEDIRGRLFPVKKYNRKKRARHNKVSGGEVPSEREVLQVQV